MYDIIFGNMIIISDKSTSICILPVTLSHGFWLRFLIGVGGIALAVFATKACDMMGRGEGGGV